MKKGLFYTIAILLLFSCSSRPKGVLSQSKMADVLYEVYLSDAVDAIKFKASVDSAKRQSYRYVLHKNNVSLANFDSSMVWYAAHPDEQEKLYDRVIKRMEELQKDVNKGKLKQIYPVYTQNDTLDIWSLERRITVGGIGMNRIPFSFDPGIFSGKSAVLLTYRLKVNKADKTSNSRMTIKMAYGNGHIDSLVSHYKKDGIWRSYRVFMPVNHKLKLTSISGYLLDNAGATKDQSATFDRIQAYGIVYANASKPKRKNSWWQLFSK